MYYSEKLQRVVRLSGFFAKTFFCISCFHDFLNMILNILIYLIFLRETFNIVNIIDMKIKIYREYQKSKIYKKVFSKSDRQADIVCIYVFTSSLQPLSVIYLCTPLGTFSVTSCCNFVLYISLYLLSYFHPLFFQNFHATRKLLWAGTIYVPHFGHTMSHT